MIAIEERLGDTPVEKALDGIDDIATAIEELPLADEVAEARASIEEAEDVLTNARKVRANARTTLSENLARYKGGVDDYVALAKTVKKDDTVGQVDVEKAKKALLRQLSKVVQYATTVVAADEVIAELAPAPEPVAEVEAEEADAE